MFTVLRWKFEEYTEVQIKFNMHYRAKLIYLMLDTEYNDFDVLKILDEAFSNDEYARELVEAIAKVNRLQLASDIVDMGINNSVIKHYTI